ncbi:MAG: MATE family efflux transporter [Bacteroidales bacterium]|nr:MATE family efflux transporter [Bacteroidales bacterium]
MKLNREILRLALPSILANITVPLVGMVDMAVAGHLPGASAAALIGGITIGAMLFDLLYWNFGFLRVGTGGLTAQAYGRACAQKASDAHGEGFSDGRCAWKAPGAHAEINGILRRALRIAFLSGLGLIALQWVVVKLAFLLVDCSPEVQALASQYFYIRIWAAPATLSLFAFKGWFIGLQDTVRPMTADLLVNFINIGASVLLGIVIGFPGIALGTFLAQWSGFTYCVIAARRRYGVTLRKEIPGQAGDVSFFALNRDLFLRSIGMIAVYIGFTVISARYGDVLLAVSAILMKLLMFFSYFTDGFAYAGEALTGRFIGERSEDGVRSTVRQTFLWGAGMAVFFMLLYGLGGIPILHLMTEDATVVDAGRQFLPWLLLMPVIGCPAFVWDGIFIGATASKALRNSTLLCAVGFFSVWFAGERFMTTPEAAIHLLMAAYFMHLAIRAGYLTLRYRSLDFARDDKGDFARDDKGE